VQSPVFIHQRISLPIHGLTHDAEGVGRYRGLTIFVPGAIPGDEVEAEIISVKKQYARALLRTVTKASPDRVAPLCPYYQDCGGCQLMHASYAAQLKYKHEQCRSALERIAGLEGALVRETLGARQPFHYRNKAQFPVSMLAGKVVAGCYQPRSHNIVDLDHCHIQHEDINKALQVAKEIAQKYQLSIYDERSHAGLLRHIVVRHAFSTGESMVIFVVNGETLPQAEKVAAELVERLPAVVSVQINFNRQPGNIILGPSTKLIAGRDFIIDQIGDLKFKISARSFFQVNPAQTLVLYEKAREYAALTGGEHVLDLYCGVGTIALFLASQAKQVTGIEIIPDAINDANENARLNGIMNTTFLSGAAEELVPRLISQGLAPEVYVIDPPRSGCDPKLLAALAAHPPQRLVYISCNPATLARDVKYLTTHGFTFVEAQPVDMFPHTSHVECVIGMQRKDT